MYRLFFFLSLHICTKDIELFLSMIVLSFQRFVRVILTVIVIVTVIFLILKIPYLPIKCKGDQKMCQTHVLKPLVPNTGYYSYRYKITVA